MLNQYEATIKGVPPKKRAEILGRIITQLMTQLPGQLAQEGYNTASSQLEAVVNNSGLGQQLSQIQGTMNSPLSSSGIGQVNVAQPLAPNTQAMGGKQPNIRQQAAANPGVAQALGIRGPTAGLLGTGNP